MAERRLLSPVGFGCVALDVFRHLARDGYDGGRARYLQDLHERAKAIVSYAGIIGIPMPQNAFARLMSILQSMH